MIYYSTQQLRLLGAGVGSYSGYSRCSSWHFMWVVVCVVAKGAAVLNTQASFTFVAVIHVEMFLCVYGCPVSSVKRAVARTTVYIP